MNDRTVIFCALVVASAALAGCYESSDVTVHEPGQYKGTVDPLLADASAREEALMKRFELIQTDR